MSCNRDSIHSTNTPLNKCTSERTESGFLKTMPVHLFNTHDVLQKKLNHQTTCRIPQEIMDAFIDFIPPVTIKVSIIEIGTRFVLPVVNVDKISPWLGIFYTLPLHIAAQKWIEDKITLSIDATNSIGAEYEQDAMRFPLCFSERIKRFKITETSLLTFKPHVAHSVPNVSLSLTDEGGNDSKTAKHLSRIVTTFIRGKQDGPTALEDVQSPYPHLVIEDNGHDYLRASSDDGFFHYKGSHLEAYQGCYIPANSGASQEVQDTIIGNFEYYERLIIHDLPIIMAVKRAGDERAVEELIEQALAGEFTCGGTFTEIVGLYGEATRLLLKRSVPAFGSVEQFADAEAVAEALGDGTEEWRKDGLVHEVQIAWEW